MRSRILTLTLKVFLDLELISSLVVDAVLGVLGDVALVFAVLLVVGIVAVTVLADHLATVLLLGELGLGPGVNELVQSGEVDTASRAAAAGGRRRAESEFDKVLVVEKSFVLSSLSANLGKAGASKVLDGVLGDEGDITLVVVVVEVTAGLDNLGSLQKTGSRLGVGGDAVAGDKRTSSGHSGEEGDDSGAEHGDIFSTKLKIVAQPMWSIGGAGPLGSLRSPNLRQCWSSITVKQLLVSIIEHFR